MQKTKTLKVLESFSGVGTQRMALRDLDIDHEVVAIAEIDEFAIKSYAAIHDGDKIIPKATDDEMQAYLEKRNIPLDDKGVRKVLRDNKLQEFYEACVKSSNLGDISKVKVEDIPDHDLFTYSFPCQSISVGGKQRGLEKGSGTRSSLLWECQKVIEGKKPKYLLMENVKNLVGKKFKPFFDEWLEYLSGLGYKNYWQVLNGKDCGVPQNRERVFVVSILGVHEPYQFPKPIKLDIRLKDILEENVDSNFYLTKDRIGQLTFKNSDISNVIANGNHSSYNSTSSVYDINKWPPTLAARDFKDPKRILVPKVEQVAQYDTPTRKNSNRFRTYDGDGISPTLTTMGGGGLEPHLLVRYDDVLIGASRGRYTGEVSEKTGRPQTQQQLEINKEGVSNTITTVQKDNYVIEDIHGNKLDNVIVRKLTPLECWRLMGISDEDFRKAESVNSNSQLYKQAGNAIIVDVLEGIFGNLFKEYILEKEAEMAS